MKCSAGYKLNPHSGTCMRFVRTRRKWFDAKSDCERKGEYLATFDTVESASWYRNQQLTAGMIYKYFSATVLKKTVLMYTTRSIVVTTLPVRRDNSCYLIDGLLA